MSGNIDDLVHREVRKWEQRASALSVERRGRGTQRPVITVSSAFGSRGIEIGRSLAALLGFDFYDRSLVDAISRSADVRAVVVKYLDERARNVIDESIVQMFEARHFASSDYLLHLSRVLVTLGRHGHAVVMGRGAQFLLDPLQTLRVRTVAPRDRRIESVSRDEGISTEAAASMIDKVDGERRAFCKQHFDRDVDDPEHYDLVVNTAPLTVKQGAELVAGAFRLRFPSRPRLDA